ncbi:MAG: hypothetical protein SCH71_16020 [Desulfobulbaceae bacterium]|nr:hypothetical protein [Desulfobulbaceae bacterium]
MLFTGAPDQELKECTGSFPATLRKEKNTHPIFVLDALPEGHLVCPCSSKGNKQNQRYIRQGCRLEITGRVTDMDSYLVEKYKFTIPLDRRFTRKLFFFGQVPLSCLGGRKRS